MNYDICVECERENERMLKKKGYCLSHTLYVKDCKKHYKNRIHTPPINYNNKMGVLIPRSYIQPTILDKKIKITHNPISQEHKDFDKNMYMLLPRN